MLELGVRRGNSTAALLAGLEERGGVLWSVDVDPASSDVFAGHPQWRFVLADSRDEAAVASAGLDGELDTLFVDTIHTYEQVHEELAAWGDRVREGGVILFHDTDASPEIRRAISEWCDARRTPFVFLPGSNGLGVAYPGGGALLRAWFRVRRDARRSRSAAARGSRRLLRLPKGAIRRARRRLASRRSGE